MGAGEYGNKVSATGLISTGFTANWQLLSNWERPAYASDKQSAVKRIRRDVKHVHVHVLVRRVVKSVASRRQTRRASTDY